MSTTVYILREVQQLTSSYDYNLFYPQMVTTAHTLRLLQQLSSSDEYSAHCLLSAHEYTMPSPDDYNTSDQQISKTPLIRMYHLMTG
jgi:hypothetical protein